MGNQYDNKLISSLYTRLMRDEVFAEFIDNEGSPEFTVYCNVIGGFIIGTALWRYNIFRSELPLALEAIRYGDRIIFEQHREFDRITLNVHFHSSSKRYNVVQQRGTLADFTN
jgi:hypothetical protein